MLIREKEPRQQAVRGKNSVRPARRTTTGTAAPRVGLSFSAWPRIWTHPVAVFIIALFYLMPLVYRGWIPHDQGTLAQCAERLLLGELPHRDFDAMYTGGLTYLNALAFILFGIKLSSIRTMFFLFTLAFVIVFHWLARRLLSPGLAALTTLVALAWSVPNYFAAMPSWYNLYFATFGVAAVVKFTEDARARWIALAGFCGGVSILFKITGLYYIAAVLMFLAFHANSALPAGVIPSAKARWLSTAFAVTASAVWVTLVSLLVHSQMDAMVFAQLVLPSVVACAAWIHQSYQRPLCTRQQIGQLVVNLGVFAAGLFAPLIVYSSVYISSGALQQLLVGVFVTPFARVDDVIYPFPNGPIALAIMVVLGLLSIIAVKRPRWDLAIAGILTSLAALLLLFPPVLARDLVFLLVRLAPPGFAVACGLKLMERSAQMPQLDQQRHYLLLATAACMPLIQFPFAAPIYFCFVFPVLFLQAQVLCNSLPRPAIRAQWAANALLLLFGVFYVDRLSFFDDPRLAAVDPPVHALELSRAGLLVTERDKSVYEPLVHTIQKHSAPDDYVLAFPDCPEVYFLAQRRNRTRTLFDLFDAKKGSRIERLNAAKQPLPKLLVLNCEPKHSRKLSEADVESVTQKYRRCEQIGSFLVCFD